jgi:hypothetical protein
MWGNAECLDRSGTQPVYGAEKAAKTPAYQVDVFTACRNNQVR